MVVFAMFFESTKTAEGGKITTDISGIGEEAEGNACLGRKWVSGKSGNDYGNVTFQETEMSTAGKKSVTVVPTPGLLEMVA